MTEANTLTHAQWREHACQVVGELGRTGNPFSADDVYLRCLGLGMPVAIIRRVIGPVLRQVQAAGQIKKLGYVLSSRNGSSAIASWAGVLMT